MNVDEFDVVFIRGDDLEPDSNAPRLFRRAKKPLYINSVDATLATKDKFQIKIRAEKNNIRIANTASEIPLYKTYRQEQYDKLADVFRENMDMKLFYKILRYGL